MWGLGKWWPRAKACVEVGVCLSQLVGVIKSSEGAFHNVRPPVCPSGPQACARTYTHTHSPCPPSPGSHPTHTHNPLAHTQVPGYQRALVQEHVRDMVKALTEQARATGSDQVVTEGCIVVARNGATGSVVLVDGQHRCAAALCMCQRTCARRTCSRGMQQGAQPARLTA